VKKKKKTGYNQQQQKKMGKGGLESEQGKAAIIAAKKSIRGRGEGGGRPRSSRAVAKPTEGKELHKKSRQTPKSREIQGKNTFSR